MTERDRLIGKINKAMFREEDRGCIKATEIADFILADRKRIEKEYEEIKEKAWKYDQLCK